MSLPSVFDQSTTTTTLARLENIHPTTTSQWGKMNAAQMLAHLNVAYDLAYGKKTTNPSFFIKLMLKWFVKNTVTNENPYPKNSRTAPEFIITDERDFETEKALLVANIKATEAKGAAYFDGKKSDSFGVMTAKEWSNQFYKHLDHHFRQFGV